MIIHYYNTCIHDTIITPLLYTSIIIVILIIFLIYNTFFTDQKTHVNYIQRIVYYNVYIS